MSRNSRSYHLQSEIGALDAQYDGERIDCRPIHRGFYLPPWRHPALCAIYRTGKVPRAAMRSVALRKEVPNPHLSGEPRPDVVPQEDAGSSIDRKEVSNPHFEEISRPKRGRPRNDEQVWYAHNLECTKRHARRLAASGKPRMRNRKPNSVEIVEALQAREKREALVRELKTENLVEKVATMLDELKRGLSVALRAPAPEYEIARKWIGREGTAVPVLVICAGVHDEGFRYAGKLLGKSRATLYRRYGERFGELRRRGETLADILQKNPALNLEVLAGMTPVEQKQIAVDRAEYAWEEQTIPRERHRRCTADRAN